jgi:hypothetical protein
MLVTLVATPVVEERAPASVTKPGETTADVATGG